MDGQVKQKIFAYADKAFSAAYSDSLSQAHDEAEDLKRRLRGTLLAVSQGLSSGNQRSG